MVQTPARSVSLEEFLALPETKPASDYIDGKIVQKPISKAEHSKLRGELVTALNAKLKSQDVAWAFPELRCTFSGQSIVPDIAVFIWEQISFDAKGDISADFVSAPDWTIDVLSSERNSTKGIKKTLRCLQGGCPISWLIDLDESLVFVYQAKQAVIYFDLETPDERLPVPGFAQNFELTVGTLFSWLKAPNAKA